MEEDGGVRVAEVAKGSNSEKLARRASPMLLSVEYVPKGTDKEPVFEDLELKKSFEAALSTLESVPQQRMIGGGGGRESNGDDDVVREAAPVAQID